MEQEQLYAAVIVIGVIFSILTNVEDELKKWMGVSDGSEKR